MADRKERITGGEIDELLRTRPLEVGFRAAKLGLTKAVEVGIRDGSRPDAPDAETEYPEPDQTLEFTLGEVTHALDLWHVGEEWHGSVRSNPGILSYGSSPEVALLDAIDAMQLMQSLEHSSQA